MAESQQIRPAHKADVWPPLGFKENAGGKDYDKSHDICKVCHARVKYTGNTTNLQAHISRHHTNVKPKANIKRVDASQPTMKQIHTKSYN